MILTIDIGNSRIKWALWRQEKIVARGVSLYDQNRCFDVFDELFSTLEKPAQIYVACVAGEKLSKGLREWCKQHWQCEVAFLKTEKQFENIINAYEDYGQHGVDRWAAVVAAHQAYPGFSVCVINAGTAVTFDFLDKNGDHLGGYILPSYVTMRKALLADTVNVNSSVGVQTYNNVVPNNTNDAVNQGLHKLLQAGIREICQFAEKKMHSPVRVVISGGFAKNILAYPDMPVMCHEPDLVMQGLYTIMQRRERLVKK